jgi:hypothetical protein
MCAARIDQFERALSDRGYVQGIHFVKIEHVAEGGTSG